MVPDGQTDGQTEGQKEWTDRRTDDAKTISLRLRRGIKSGWISGILAENTVHYHKKANMFGWLFLTFFRSILQTACCETESKTVCNTATSWFLMVSASCTIDPTET